jgi:3-methyladenine DNA glycosylase AlkD
MPTLIAIKHALAAYASAEKAQILQRFFKTGPGEYGAGDQFLGVVVPDTRKVARQFRDLPDELVVALLHSPIHEERLLALFIWVEGMKRAGKTGETARMQAIASLYAAHRAWVNNWDLVDCSAHLILGPAWGLDGLPTLIAWATGGTLWERRIAILTTFHFIRLGNPAPALQIADLLLHDPHDLIHKAVGWMLREVGNRQGQATLEAFLLPRYPTMPRTMLRYAIERLPEARRQEYLAGRA